MRRITALLLCVLMVFPTQGIFTLADNVEGMEEQKESQNAGLDDPDSQLADEEEWQDGPVIYWNPGTELVGELATGSNASQATASNAQPATASNAGRGNDQADGKSPSTPVKTLAKALEKAEELQDTLGVAPSDITIYAMNPMEVEDGKLYVLNVGNMRIASWPGRSYDNDTVFYLNGGQLSLTNARIESGDREAEPERTDLIYIRSGALQLGRNAAIEGRMIFDYQKKEQADPWETATVSDAATKSNASFERAADGEGAVFDLNEYILNTDEDSIELIEEDLHQSTWRKPIIELTEDFVSGTDQYLLEVRGDDFSDDIELVKTLYADDKTEAEFQEMFALTETDGCLWTLRTESEAQARVRDTGAGILALFRGLEEEENEAEAERGLGTALMTQKILKATRSGSSDKVVYWNPGGSLTVSGIVYPAGTDTDNDGNTPKAPVKTWKTAVDKANGGTIICMQRVVLGAGAEAFIGAPKEGAFVIESSSADTMVTLKIWESQPVPAFVVGQNQTLVLRNIILAGYEKDGAAVSARTVHCVQGDVIIEENVTAETGIIQIDAFKELADHPIVVKTVDSERDGMITLFFGGINDNLSYRYVDVVVPGGDLKLYAEGSKAQAELVGEELKARFRLDQGNRNSENGGSSRFDWRLRPDTAEDDGIETPQNLELYTNYYYDAIYLDGVRGNDKNFGATCQYPVATWKKAREIWQTEMVRNIAVRKAASLEGYGEAYINEMYPLPNKIYICGTVTVDETQSWGLTEYTDYDGTTKITTEVISHTHIPNLEGGNSPVHQAPELLVEVTGGAVLTLNQKLIIRNMTNLADSATIEVQSGSKLVMADHSVLTGERKAAGGDTAMAATAGSHIRVLDGTLLMEAAWDGAVMRREQGVSASGTAAVVTMNGGQIKENTYVPVSVTRTPFKGAGIALRNGARFTMNGGEITANVMYEKGGGVYLEGAGTRFDLVKGKVWKNQTYRISNTAIGYGVGIFAGADTILNVGTAGGAVTDAVIAENAGYRTYGGGIYSAGKLTVKKATISGNSAGGSHQDYYSYGVGIFVENDSSFHMNGAHVTGNNTAGKGNYGVVYGVGIFIQPSGALRVIENSTISGNKAGAGYGDRSYGGGIFTYGELKIADCDISDNVTSYGGGIFVSGIQNKVTNLTIDDTMISNNQAHYDGGGIYAGNYTVNIVMNKITAIQGNKGGRYGGGLTLSGSGMKLTVNSPVLGDVKFCNNSSGQEGGGLYNNQGTIYADLVVIADNTAGTTGGGIMNGGQFYSANAQITGNTARDGGGIYNWAREFRGDTLEITGNTATAAGGGIFTRDGSVFLMVSDVSANRSDGQGGGVHTTGGVTYLTDSRLVGNTAVSDGGGACLAGGTLYLTETIAKKSEFHGNEAVNGGGIYTINGVFAMDIAGDIKNTAAAQGSNLYIKRGGSWVLAGRLQQPDTTVPGIYNVYVEIVNVNASHQVYLDMEKVTIEKKSGGKPDAVYLKTANSFLTYMTAPPTGVHATFPIDVNPDEFDVGSVVIKPWALNKVTMWWVKRDASNIVNRVSYDLNYPLLKDATVNLSYSDGGDLPRRMQLGGYEDSFDPAKTNAVLVGEGVYLSTTTGLDTNGGTSPADAVASFDVAKTKLESRIHNRLQDEQTKGLNQNEVMGYSPYIYICGTVRVSDGEKWDLNYDAPLFTTTNQNYDHAEKRDGIEPFIWGPEYPGEVEYPAEVRRFASFIKAPMIEVGNGTNQVDFTFGKVIIDGMAEAVIRSDQGEKSPIVQIKKNSSAVLTGNTELRNNYKYAVEVYGDLFLNSRIEVGETPAKNRQLINIHGHFVRLFASANLEMDDYSRILADRTITRKDSSTFAVYSNAGGTSVTMKGNSAIEYLNQKIDDNDTANAKDPALYHGISLDGGTSTVHLEGAARIENLRGYGIIVRGNNNNILLKDSAVLKSLGNTSIYSDHSNLKLIIRDQAGINTTAGHGIGLYNGSNTYVQVRDQARITGVAKHGIECGDKNAQIYLQDFAQIEAGEHGVRLYSGGNKLSVNREEGSEAAEDGDSVKIKATHGITSYDPANTILLGKNALIQGRTSKAGHGIYLGNSDLNGGQTTVSIKDNARITDFENGIGSGDYVHAPVYIRMEDKVSIDNNKYGIRETTSWYGLRRLRIEIAGDARITNNTIEGVSLHGHRWDSVNYQLVILTDNAQICNNAGNGITANGPVEVELNGAARITGNTKYGMYLTRSNIGEYRGGTGKVTLNTGTSVDNNGGGIYVTAGYAANNRPNPFIITLNGASIRDNTDAVYLMDTDQVLQLNGSSFIGERKLTGTGTDNRALVNYGTLELDGRSIIESRSYLHTGNNPIVLTYEIQDPTRVYHLWLAEGYLGKPVVVPNDPGSDHGGITDVTGELEHFIKDGADGLAAPKLLVKAAPNIVLEGNNDVYLSGTGNDALDGNSPSTAVRTFKRARELLRSGYFSEGANIKICNSVVIVLPGDEDWSFDPGGTVTNSRTGDTWKPLVIRYQDYKGTLIRVDLNGYNYPTADTVTFKNITIDGGSEAGITLNSYINQELLLVAYEAKAIVSDGAVFQNNRAVTNTHSEHTVMGIRVHRAILDMDGGIIRNMVIESSVGNNNSHPASAVLVQNAGTFNFKSGQIVENQMIYPNVYSGSCVPSAVSVYGINAKMDMSGGVIAGNVAATNNKRGSALFILDGLVTISGGVIRDNKGSGGSAVWYYGTDNSGLIMSGGQISGNKPVNSSVKAENDYSPLYIEGPNFQLKGGGADIRDNIYLPYNNRLIKVSGDIYQPGRLYNVFLRQGSAADQFKKGSTVIQPDGVWITDVTPYLSYFQVHSNPYILDRGQTTRKGGTVNGIMENQCLILMKAVYLDSVNGRDADAAYDGSTPAKAKNSFTKAKAEGENGFGDKDYYVIYISGTAINTAAETSWQLPATAYMSRYTGFPVYQADGSETPEIEYPYHGYLIEPASDLTLDGISIFGRRAIDTIESKGDSIIRINSGVRVTISQATGRSTVIGRNYNIGEFYNPSNGSIDNLSSQGGAVQVNIGGTLELTGGTILDTNAAYGSAVYLAADQADASKTGRFYLKDTPSVAGVTYLAGSGSATAAYVEPDQTYRPAAPLEIAVGNDYNGRPVIRYPMGVTPGTTELDYFKFADSLKALYDIVNRPGETNVLELNMRRMVYLDGRNGSDSADGSTPESAYRTLKKVYEEIGSSAAGNGILVLVVDTVELSASSPKVTLNNILIRNSSGIDYYQGMYQDNQGGKVRVDGQVYFKRYVQPDGYSAGNPQYQGYNRPTLMGPLFNILGGGELSINGLYLDGHSEDSSGAQETLVAAGVEALAPLVRVDHGGILTAGVADKDNMELTNGIDTVTLFTNNINKNQKTNVIGNLKGSDILEGSSAGIELVGGSNGARSGGKAVLVRAEFRNLRLGGSVVSGGTDVYSFGDLHFSDRTFFGGTVFLEGFGDILNPASHDSSHYMTVDFYGEPAASNFQTLVRDPYNTRIVVHYPVRLNEDEIAIDEQAGRYLLEERVKDYFYLGQRTGAKYILELQVPVAVYIDGANGIDDPLNLVAGSTPSTPVKSLKRAFELLKTRAGNTIYVVGTIQIDTDTYVTGTSYRATDGNIQLGSTDKVRITRYIQPDFALGKDHQPEIISAGYNVKDYTGVLLNVKDGTTAVFSSNVYFDGHSQPKNTNDYAKEAMVDRESEAKAPLISVARGGTLELQHGVTLLDNNNTYLGTTGETGLDGGVVYNSGTTNVDGALFTNNHAEKGSAAYQDGTFTILSAPEKLIDHSFYLTTVNSGTPGAPVWGEDHVIRTKAAIPDGQTFQVDMDNAVKGRDVVRFTEISAFNPDADAEHDHFVLGDTVPNSLFLVEAVDDDMVLELQNWEVLDVEVPSDIYLVMQRNSYIGGTARLMGVDADVTGSDLLSAPEYVIANKGRYDVKVSVTGFENQNSDAGITHDVMSLKASRDAATGKQDLYLAMKGLDSNGNDGFAMAETPLDALAGTSRAELGTLKSGSLGRFAFIGAADGRFIEHYADSTFPMSGVSKEDVQDYMDGTAGTVNARAKYKMKYKLELVPERR